jgi:hypothetical protein
MIGAEGREGVAPDMENGDATVGGGSPEQEIEPLDSTIGRGAADRRRREQPRDEDGRFVKQEGVDITIINVDEEIEVVDTSDGDELATAEEMA